MSKQWLDYVKQYRRAHPELTYKQALQAASVPFHEHKRKQVMHGGFDPIWAAIFPAAAAAGQGNSVPDDNSLTMWNLFWWYCKLHTAYCLFCALSAGGLAH